ncbi:glycosyl transferase family 2 [Intrasporangium oryzae NRRL B-24470]|uniref:Glycosyl transferase family 2 n=1 Tax=Intrasporangium oryzae NRRL B-24470 TaxID=1386089 RepID=W9GB99_9MICO|nr:glycosyltransferase family 2 protein [Intrasporangium oryzae]EWT01134.1 glycosyl transferase family 2 [Intrasporangium oryzae NRRL B-24470]
MDVTPPVSVVMPLLNEALHLERAVDAIVGQNYPGDLEIVLAVGPGHDDTLGVARRLAEKDDRIVVVENPSGRTPDALNLATAAARHDIIVRVDGHGFLSRGYIARAVRALEEHDAANVGGIMQAEGVTDFEKAVAVAMTSPLGVGGARFHTGGEAGPADTVYLGVFRSEWLRKAGGYDPRFTRAQDWELNYRIRRDGGLVWFDPELTVQYRPRGSFRALAKQYRDYGRWRRVVAKRHPGSINARYLAPPTAVLAIAGGLVGGFFWRPLWAIPAAYATAIGAGGVVIARGQPWRVAIRVPGVLATMHCSWGWGFLTSQPNRLVPEED